MILGDITNNGLKTTDFTKWLTRKIKTVKSAYSTWNKEVLYSEAELHKTVFLKVANKTCCYVSVFLDKLKNCYLLHRIVYRAGQFELAGLVCDRANKTNVFHRCRSTLVLMWANLSVTTSICENDTGVWPICSKRLWDGRAAHCFSSFSLGQIYTTELT